MVLEDEGYCASFSPPRVLLQLEPEHGQEVSQKYLKKESWDNLAAQKGKISSVYQRQFK